MKSAGRWLLIVLMLWGAIGAGVDTAAATEAKPWFYAGVRGLLCCSAVAILIVRSGDRDA